MVTLVALKKELNMPLMEEIFNRKNMLLAHKRVVSNKGSPGVDGIAVDELWSYCQERWSDIRSDLLSGNYKPKPVKRVDIPKPGGMDKRKLGIPCTVDRLILQAVNQVLSPIFDPHFSKDSFGFRPGKSAHDALKRAGEHIASGHAWIVNFDLSKFFDHVDHDILMSNLHRKVKDKAVLHLIRRYLRSGSIADDKFSSTTKGTIQGGPLSPLLSNVMLDDLDKELENRGHKFCRYGDDFNIYVKSQRAGKRVLKSVEQYLEKKLHLTLNEEKSGVVRPKDHIFLGYGFYGVKSPRLRIAPKSYKRFRDKVRSNRRRWKGSSMEQVVKELNQMVQGWVVYFRLADGREKIRRLESWLMHHLRNIHWRQWKTPRTRFKKMIGLDVNRDKAARAAWGRGGPWASSATQAMNLALRNSYFENLGWIGLIRTYEKFKISVKFV